MAETRRLPSPEIDHVRFGYVVKHRLEALDLSYDQAMRLTGCSRRQLSYAVNGKPICAGATHVLAVALDIDIEEMLPVETRERLYRIRLLRAEEQEARRAEGQTGTKQQEARRAEGQTGTKQQEARRAEGRTGKQKQVSEMDDSQAKTPRKNKSLHHNVKRETRDFAG